MANTPTVKKDDALHDASVVEVLEDIPEKKKGKKTVLIIVIVAVVLLLCCCLILVGIGLIPMLDGYGYYDFGFLLPLMSVV